MATPELTLPASQPPVSTGIAGLDTLLRGGFTPNRMYLVEGRPGTGKTTIAMQFLLEGRERGEGGLYVALSETANELRAVGASHGWTLDGIELFQLPTPQHRRGRGAVHPLPPGRGRARATPFAPCWPSSIGCGPPASSSTRSAS